MNEERRGSALVLALILLLGLLVRLPMLGYSFYGDEGFTVVRDTNELITTSEDRFRPVFFSLVYLWKQLGFDGEIGLRLLPLLFGLAQIPFAFVIGRTLGGRALAVTFSILIAASPMLIEFSQELRMYSLVALIALAQAYILLRLLDSEPHPRPFPTRSGEGRTTMWVTFVLIGIIGVYTHLHYWLFLAGLSLTFVRERRVLAWWRGFAALGATAVVYALNYKSVLLFMELRGGEYAMHFPSALPKLLAAFTVGFNYFKLPEQGLDRAIGTADLAMNLSLVALAAVPAVVIAWRLVWLHTGRRSETATSILLSHELFTIPVLLALVASLITHKYWLQPKYLIFSAPFALLFIAQAYLAIERVVLRKAVVAFSVALLVVALVHFWQPREYGRRENWRAAAELLEASLDESSALVLLPGTYRLLTYYAPELDGRWITVNPPDSAAQASAFENEVRAKLAGKSDVYYLRHDVVQNLQDPRDLLPLALDNFGTPAGAVRFNPRFQLLRWEVR